MDRILAADDEGGNMEEILEEIDVSGDISAEFRGKSPAYIEKYFERELAGVKLTQNEILYKTLCGDDSPEAKAKIAEIIKENKLLNNIRHDNKITGDF